MSERRAWVTRGGERIRRVRPVRVRLRRPTAGGDAAVEILTNRPAKAPATRAPAVDLTRWRIEGALHEWTVARNCEANILGYPRAARSR